MVDTPLHELDQTATTLRHYRFVTLCGWECVILFGCIVMIALVDSVTHLGQWPRLMVLVMIVLGISTSMAFGIRRCRKRPDDVVALAMHVEDERGVLRGWLAAAVELRNQPGEASAQCVLEASNRLHTSGPISVPKHGPMAAIGALVLFLMVFVVTWVVAPTTTSTALHRILLPLGATTWPARTAVASAMPINLVHGRGLPLRVQAYNTTPGGSTEPVHVVLQLTLSDGTTRHQRELLAHHNGNVHGAVISIPPNATGAMVRFETTDASTVDQHIPIKPLPSLKSTHLTVTPPWTHTSVIEPKSISTQHAFPQFQERLIQGSSVELTMVFDPEVQAPDQSSDTTTSWARKSLGWTLPYLPDIDGTASSWSLRWVMDSDCMLQLHMEDADGLQALDHPQLRLINSVDLVPEMVLIQPDIDIALPPTAIFNMHGRVVDDYPLHRLSLRVDPRSGDARSFLESKEHPGIKATIETTVSLESLGVEPGDILELRVEAEDLGDATTGHRVVQGRARTIQVVSLERFLDDVQKSLMTIGDQVRKLESRQTVLLEQSKDGAWSHTSATSQTRIARDIRSASEDASSVLDALDMGNVDALDLRLLADEAVLVLQDTVDLAMASSASEIGRYENQLAVQIALDTLANRLSGDHDQWAARRMVRDLLERQKALQSSLASTDTKTTTNQTQRSTTLDAIHDAQQTLADDVQRVASSLDGTRLASVANALVEDGVEDNMRRAAVEANNNRIGLAQSAQALAASSLERINDELTQSTQATKTKVATLKRRLLDLQALIVRLLGHQRTVLGEFTNQGKPTELTQQLQRVHRGILSAVQRATRAGNTTHGIESILTEASSIQSSAIIALLQSPIDIQTAHQDALFVESHLVHVLDLIQDEAGDLARREHTQQATQLAGKLNALATQQQIIRTGTEPHLRTGEQNRRGRFELRKLGAQQTMLIDEIESLAATDTTIKSSIMAHVALQAASSQANRVATSLIDGVLTMTVIADQQHVEFKLRRLADAITSGTNDASGESSPFSRSNGGGASGSNGGGEAPQNSTLPSVAELRILRGLQADLLERTQSAIADTNQVSIESITADQLELAQLGAMLMDEVSTQHRAVVEELIESNTHVKQAPSIPIQLQARSSPQETIVVSQDLPSLDTLLGLDDGPPTKPMPSVPDDALAAVSARLKQAADALQNNSRVLAGRLQVDALDRIDALLRQAQQQSRANQSQSTSGDPMAQAQEATAAGDAQGQPTSGNVNGDDSGETNKSTSNTVDPQVGGIMEHHGAAWGTLPPRLRAMLEQGHHDDTSLLYADICANYFRMLLESSKP